MNRYCLLISCVAALSPALADANQADAIVGVWVNAEKDGYIEITKNGDVFDGTIVGSANPEDADMLDRNNPDPERRDQPLMGLKILKGFRYAGGNEWTGGTIYDPNNGKTYKSNLELNNDGTLNVRGYVGISLFGRTETWTRKTPGD